MGAASTHTGQSCWQPCHPHHGPLHDGMIWFTLLLVHSGRSTFSLAAVCLDASGQAYSLQEQSGKSHCRALCTHNGAGLQRLGKAELSFRSRPVRCVRPAFICLLQHAETGSRDQVFQLDCASTSPELDHNSLPQGTLGFT